VVLEKLAKKGTYTVSLTLRVPSNILHVEKTSHDLIGAIDHAVAALVREVKSLKAELRGDYRWKRPLYRARLRADKALIFAEPMEPSTGPQTHADIVSELLKAHNKQLLAHARREVRTAELTGDLPRGAVDQFNKIPRSSSSLILIRITHPAADQAASLAIQIARVGEKRT